MLTFFIVGLSTIWMHLAIRRMDRARIPDLAEEWFPPDIPDAPFAKPGG